MVADLGYIDKARILWNINDNKLANPKERDFWQRLWEYVAEFETANVAPVVRCKECRYHRYSALFNSEYTCYCTIKCSYYKPEDYCSGGERYVNENE